MSEREIPACVGTRRNLVHPSHAISASSPAPAKVLNYVNLPNKPENPLRTKASTSQVPADPEPSAPPRSPYPHRATSGSGRHHQELEIPPVNPLKTNPRAPQVPSEPNPPEAPPPTLAATLCILPLALDTPLTYLKGVGPARAAILAAKGLQTLEDLL